MGLITTSLASSPTKLGQSIFESKCVMCHGTNGKGDGVAAPLVHPRPRDFTSGFYKFRSTESGNIPTDQDLRQTIGYGLYGTSMPGWKEFIAGDSLDALIEYIKSFSLRFKTETPRIVTIGEEISASPANIAAGKKVYEKLQCASCHGMNGDGIGAIATNLKDNRGDKILATNLTEPWMFRRGASAHEIYLRFRTGIDGTPMPSYAGSANNQEMWQLAYYVVSLARKPVWSMNEEELKTFYSTLDQGFASNPLQRGEYLAKTLACPTCHTPLTENGKLMEEMLYAGGSRWSAGPYGDYFANNLTSDKETGLGNWTDDEIKLAITRGISKDGRRFLPFTMPWTSCANLNEQDLHAIVTYLRSIPPISNKIPKPQSLNFFSYLWGKFKMLILKEDIAVEIHTGNAGAAGLQTVSQNLQQSHNYGKEK